MDKENDVLREVDDIIQSKGKSAKDDPQMGDTEEPTDKKSSTQSPESTRIKDTSKLTPEDNPWYGEIKELMDEGRDLVMVTNTSQRAHFVDWDLSLLPEDFEEGWEQFLAEEHVRHGLEDMANKETVAAIFRKGQTVSFLDNFLRTKHVPITIDSEVGDRVVYRSVFYIDVDESVIMTPQQAESLDKYKKQRMKVKLKSGREASSDWAGFLVFKYTYGDNDDIKFNKNNLPHDVRHIVTREAVMRLSKFEDAVPDVQERAKVASRTSFEVATE